MNSKKMLAFALSACILTLLLPASTAATDAFTLPISGKLIHGTLTLSDGEQIQFTVLEGAMFSVQDESSGIFLGFTPTIEDEAEQRVSFKIFEIKEVGPGLQALKQLDDVIVLKALGVGSPSLPAYSQLTLRGISDSGLSNADVEKMRNELRAKPNLGPDN